jgi:hypothetical protein
VQSDVDGGANSLLPFPKNAEGYTGRAIARP